MLIEIDLNETKRLKITVNQFILISLLISKNDIKSLLDVIPISETDINNLIEQNILTKESILDFNDFSKLIVTEEFTNKLKVKDFFAEFYDLYPVSIMRPDGLKDYLRGDISRCRKYYNNIVGKSKSKHKHMIDCLKFEISKRKQSNSMQYMKRMSKWLLSEEWLLYDEFMKEDGVEKDISKIYGTTVE